MWRIMVIKKHTNSIPKNLLISGIKASFLGNKDKIYFSYQTL
jgi:hypothetical protein